MALHTAHHGVTTNDNPLNISVGYVAAEQSGFHKVVTDWSEANGTEQIHVVLPFQYHWRVSNHLVGLSHSISITKLHTKTHQEIR